MARLRPIVLSLLGCVAASSVASAAVNLPNALPSTIQANLDDPAVCPATGCHLILPCGTYLADGDAGNSPQIKIWIHNQQNVRITGCGMNGTTIKWSGAPNSAGWLLLINGTSRWITIEDVRLEIECSGGCTSGTQVAQVYGPSADVTFERVHFHAMDPGGTMSSPFPTGLALSGDANGGAGGTPARRINVYSSNLHATGYGLNSYYCDDCWFNGNWFGGMTGTTGMPVSRASYALASKFRGLGVRFTNNTFDMGGSPAVQVGLYLRGGSAAGEFVGSTAQVIGNSFTNLQDSAPETNYQRPVFLYRYNRAIIEGNVFACPETDTGCTSYGVDFLAGVEVCPPGTICNQENLIANNMFDRLVDNDSTLCPVRLQPMASGPANTNNVVHGNIFRLGTGSTVGADGVCGANEALNFELSNKAFGP